ncbi:MAG: aminotransferase class V-fold PLP-dependent enzyme, partial [bacterium]|nr:aminotransferase class V-fold PLP-dependent enzyme [bacterium]
MHPWNLDPDVVHLNHGSFGACPAPVLEEQRRWQKRMEANPVRFFTETLQPAIDTSRIALAKFVGADPDGLVFVPNATAGINSVLRSLEPDLGPGDEIIVTNHTYNACRNVAEVSALRTGAELVEVPVPFPIENAESYV